MLGLILSDRPADRVTRDSAMAHLVGTGMILVLAQSQKKDMSLL